MARKNDGLVVGVLTGLGALLLLGIASSSSRRKSRGELLAEAAQGALRRVVLALNIHEPPLILIDGGARNAWSDGHQIGINLRWIDSEISTACHSAACTMAVVVGVIAHELGHHHHGDAFSDDQHTCGLNHPRELRADRIAGWVLGKLGADQRDFARVMAKSSWSCTHPPGHERFAAIEAGYAAAVRGVPWTVL